MGLGIRSSARARIGTRRSFRTAHTEQLSEGEYIERVRHAAGRWHASIIGRPGRGRGAGMVEEAGVRRSVLSWTVLPLWHCAQHSATRPEHKAPWLLKAEDCTGTVHVVMIVIASI